MRADSRRSGFTLLELIVVLTVIGVVLAVNVPSLFASGRGLDTRRAVTFLANDLRQAQRHAVTAATGAGVEFDLARRQVRSGSATRALPAGLSISVTAARSQAAGDRAGGIWFYPDGSSTGGRVTLADGRKTYWIDIDWITGRVATSSR
jgi:general secretion pathway protein H